jgi:phospholipid-binding lipoprotein MlaA
MLGLAACSTVRTARQQAGPQDSSATTSTPAEEVNPDPWESFNRDISTFNDTVDELLAKPVAKAYKTYMPSLVRTSISNFFFNLSSLPSAANNLLQGRVQAAAEGLIRVGVNTVFGFGGLIDLASEMNIERHKADFGQTLGRWGIPTGPYLVVPFLGPTTLRDAVASVLVSKDEVIQHIPQIKLRNSLYLLRSVDQRANLLRATTVLDEAALDRYSFTRDIFLQVRRNEVEGEPPEEPESQATPSLEPALTPGSAAPASDAMAPSNAPIPVPEKMALGHEAQQR